MKKSVLKNVMEWVGVVAAVAGVVLAALGVFLLVWGGISAISALILCWAWNAFMVPVFALPAIGFWKAFALLMLLGFIKQAVNVAVNNSKKD